MRRLLPLAVLALSCSAAALNAETITYTYDELGRLIRTSVAGGPGGEVSTTYTYDKAGNRTAVKVSSAQTPTPSPTPSPTPGPTPTPSPTPTPTPTGSSGAVVNWSFEQPAVAGLPGGFQYNPSVSGTYFAGNSGVAANGGAWGFALATDGSQVGFLQSTPSTKATITLNVSNLTPGARYVVKFRMAQRPGWGADTIFVAAINNALGTHTPSSTSFQSVTTVAFTPATSVGTLYFEGTARSGDLTVALDSISIVAAP